MKLIYHTPTTLEAKPLLSSVTSFDYLKRTSVCTSEPCTPSDLLHYVHQLETLCDIPPLLIPRQAVDSKDTDILLGLAALKSPVAFISKPYNSAAPHIVTVEMPHLFHEHLTRTASLDIAELYMVSSASNDYRPLRGGDGVGLDGLLLAAATLKASKAPKPTKKGKGKALVAANTADV